MALGVLKAVTKYSLGRAKKILGPPKTLQLKKSFIIRQSLQSDFLSALGPVAPNQMLALPKASAEDDRDLFQQYFLPQLDKDLPPVPMILEATASFSSPLDDDFYFRFIDSDDKKAFAAFNALAELRRPMAITFLRSYIEKGKRIDTPLLDLAFMKLGHHEFVRELRVRKPAYFNPSCACPSRSRGTGREASDRLF